MTTMWRVDLTTWKPVEVQVDLGVGQLLDNGGHLVTPETHFLEEAVAWAHQHQGLDCILRERDAEVERFDRLRAGAWNEAMIARERAREAFRAYKRRYGATGSEEPCPTHT